jgi:hypothetical protein
MKTILIALIVAISSINAMAVSYGDSMATVGNLQVYIVLDCGKTDMETWETLRGRAIETVCTLKAGDRVSVITAHPMQARLYLDGTISENKASVDSIVKKLATLGKDWVARADLPSALEFTCENMYLPSDIQKCCIVLTTGNVSNEELNDMLSIAKLFSTKKWPLVTVCEHTKANRQFIVSEMKVHYLNQPAIAEWLGSIRPIHSKSEPNMPTQVSQVSEANSTKVDNKPKNPMTPSSPDPNSQVTPSASGVPLPSESVPQTPPLLTDFDYVIDNNEERSDHLEPNDIPEFRPGAEAGDVNQPLATYPDPVHNDPCDDGDVNVPDSAQKLDTGDAKSLFANFWKGSVTKYGIAAIVIIGVIAFIVVVIANYRNAKTPGNTTDKKKVTEAEFSIFAIKDDKDEHPHNLGVETSIRTLFFGSAPQSAVPLAGEGIEPKEFQLSNKGGKFTIKNTSSHILTVNGIAIKQQKQWDVIFPVSIQSAYGLNLVIVRENSNQVSIKKETDKDETAK